MKRIYLDHAAATPLIKEARAALRRTEELFGNPSSSHTEGRAAKECLEESRKRIARILSVKPHEVIFTGNATEANTLAILGHVTALHEKGRNYEDMEVLMLSTEHSSILELKKPLLARSVSVHMIPVKEDGRIDLEVFQKLLSEKTVLVSSALVNSEIGVIQPLRKIRSTMRTHAPHAILHTDAAQAPRVLSVEPHAYMVELMTLDSLKVGGGVGAGALISLNQTSLSPILRGGGQERGKRSGTENVPAASSFAEALEDAEKHRSSRLKTWEVLQGYLFERLISDFHDVIPNGSREHRSPSNVNISLVEHDTEYLSVLLDKKGISVGTTSACDEGGGVSRVVAELEKGNMGRSSRTLRITFGPETTRRDIDRLLNVLHEVLPLTKA